MKKQLQTNVYEEAKLRIKYIFNNFDLIQISFSGGKDSGVMLEYIKEKSPTKSYNM